MRNKNFVIKMICLVFIMVFAVGIFNINNAEAADKSCDYWDFDSVKDPVGYWNSDRDLYVKTYYNGKYVQNMDVYYDGNPGNITIVPKGYYTVDSIELWNTDWRTEEITTRNGAVKSNIYQNVNIGSWDSKTLIIYIKDKRDNYYTLSNISTSDSGNSVLRVNTYLDGTDIGSIVYQENYIVGNVTNLTVNQNNNYIIDSIKLDSSVIENGNNSISVGNNLTKELNIYLKTKPILLTENEYNATYVTNNSTGNRKFTVITYLNGSGSSNIINSQSFSVNQSDLGFVTVEPKEGYEIHHINYRGSSFINGSKISSLPSGESKLEIYMQDPTTNIAENELIDIVTVNNQDTYYGNRTLTINIYIDGTSEDKKVGDSIVLKYNDNGTGVLTVTTKEGYDLHHMLLGTSNFPNGSSIAFNYNNRILNVYLNTPQQNFSENDYITTETERYQDSYGSKTLTIETYVDGSSSSNKMPQDIIKTYDSSGTGTVSITAKQGYSFHHLTVNNGSNINSTSTTVNFGSNSSRTLRVYLQSTPANTTENEYIKFVSGNDKDYYATGSARNINVNTYVDGTSSGSRVDSKTIKYSSSGPGTITITAKEGYVINSLTYNGVTYSNVTKATFNYANGKNDINIYLKSLKYLTVNYYYDGVIDSTKTYHAEKVPGDQIVIQSKMVDDLVFQKATISNDDSVRSIDLDTKNVTLTMPNKSVTVEFYYVTEGDVLLSKTATPVPGTINNFNIEIKAEGTPFVSTKSADIVLVFDKSGSMGYSLGNKTRLAVLKEAADKFINSVMPANSISLNRVAIVVYSGERYDGTYNDAYVLQEFTSSNTIAKNSYKDNNLRAEGGTNNEAGFKKAKEVMSNARAGVEKYVIYMTDGEPTFYYDKDGYTAGPGNEYSETAKNNAITEALKLKNQSVTIYTVALSPDDTTRIQQVLNPSGTNKYQKNYYHATTANELTAIYSLLATEINDEIASNAVITDTLPEDFIFDAESLEPKDGSVTINNDTLTWYLDKINVGEKSININAKYTGNNYGIMYTNDRCLINYNHVNTPDTLTTKEFEKPLQAMVPVISTNYYEIGKDSNLTIDPKIYLNKINEGLEHGYVVTDIEIILDTQPANGTVLINEDGTLTYIPNSGYTGNDDFTYTVSMTIINDEGDPFEIVGTYTNDVNVTVNILNKYELRVNYLYGDTPINSPKVLYKYANDLIGESALDISGYRFVETQHVGVINPVISGKSITGKMSSVNASITFKYEKNDYNYKVEYYYDGVWDATKTYNGSGSEGSIINSYEDKGVVGYTFVNDSGPITISKDESKNIIKVNYVKIKNELETHTMYDKKLAPINKLNIVKDFEYTFGFRFKSGQNGSMAIQLETDLSKFNISDFTLYNASKIKIGEGIREISRVGNTISMETTSLEYGKEYIVIYNIKGNERSNSIPVKLINAYLVDNGNNPIDIKVTQPGLE